MAHAGRCTATTKTGAACSASHYRDGWCRWHHPDLEAERQAARVAGGKAKSTTARAKKRVLREARDLRDVDAQLCIALDDVLAGRIEANVATAAASLARAIATVRQAGDLEARLEALEAAAGLAKERGA